MNLFINMYSIYIGIIINVNLHIQSSFVIEDEQTKNTDNRAKQKFFLTEKSYVLTKLEYYLWLKLNCRMHNLQKSLRWHWKIEAYDMSKAKVAFLARVRQSES